MNEEVTVNVHHFKNIGYVMARMPENLVSKLRAQSDDIMNDRVPIIPEGRNLAGHLAKQFHFDTDDGELESFLRKLAVTYEQTFNYLEHMPFQRNPEDLKLINCWINYQSKGEYNPAHTHGGLLSFVIWLQLPFFHEVETSIDRNPVSTRKVSGCFEFSYTNALGSITQENITADRRFENHVIMFPAVMTHQVYPFYSSDDYRISISGNLV